MAPTLLLTLGIALQALGAAKEPRSSEAFFVSDGVCIRYLVQGSGPPVLLVHGFSITAELNWVVPGILADEPSAESFVA